MGAAVPDATGTHLYAVGEGKFWAFPDTSAVGDVACVGKFGAGAAVAAVVGKAGAVGGDAGAVAVLLLHAAKMSAMAGKKNLLLMLLLKPAKGNPAAH